MSVLPIQALAGLGLLQVAASLPSVIRSADFAGLLRGRQAGTSDQSGPSPATGNGLASRPSTGAVDAPGLRAQTDALADMFGARLNQILSENGLDTSPGLHLQLGAAGRIRIAGSHPQQESIEAALAANPELTDIFRAMAANLQLLRAIESPQDDLPGESPATVDLYVDATGAKASLVDD